MFHTQFPTIHGLKILEVGSGVGEIFDLINKRYENENYSYTLTEYSPNAVGVLKSKYVNKNDIFEADAVNLPFRDSEYDLVCSFDVMHHVSDAFQMAKEMLRVTNKYFFLCEPNGLSLIRKLGEISPEAKKLGEKSYFPWEYKNFFARNGAKKEEIKPFYFFVPPKIKKQNMKPFVAISEIGQNIPILKWQSQSLSIFGEK